MAARNHTPSTGAPPSIPPSTLIGPTVIRRRLYFQVADVLFSTFAQAATVWTAAFAHRLDFAQPLEQEKQLPLRRCDDCALDLGRDVLRAIDACPRWRKSRRGVESHCPEFVAKDGAR